MDISENPGENPTTAMSLFGSAQNGGDFPVLKAFQEYIDAEQAKARKRMLGLSIFFVVLLSIVVVTFTLIVVGVINRNQTLSDRLLDVALRQQAASVQPQPQPVVNVQPAPVPQPDLKSDLKPVLEKIEQLASAVANQVRQPQPIIQPVMQPMPIIQPAPAVTPAKADDTAVQAEAARLREELKREKEKMEIERKKLKEAQRQAEVEAHRRRLYPEYYAKKDAEAQAQKQKGTALPVVVSPSQTARKTTPVKVPSKASEAENIKPRDYSARATDDDDARIEALAQEVRRRQAAEAKQKKAAADAAEAAQRAAAANAAAKKSQAEAAEAERKKAAADAEKKKASAAAAEADSRKAAALAAKKQADAIVAEAEREKAEYKRAKAEAQMKANAAETLTVKTKDADSVPWIIQRLND